MRAFLYCRVAHEDSFALEHQRFQFQFYAKQAGYTIIGAADEYGSGLTLDRPALRKVTEAVVAGKVDVVFVQSLTRIGREWGMTQSYIDLLTRHKVKLLCIRERLLFDENGPKPFYRKNAEYYQKNFSDPLMILRMDENWLDVTGSVGLFGDPMTVAKEISGRIKFELGITASIGVADNKITAKLGSDYKKPDAITRIEQDNYKEIVYPLPVEDLLYVGPATSKNLRGIGISTIGRLAECPVDLLVRKFGKMGAVLHTFANGMDTSPVQRSDHIPNIKSVGNSATTPRNLEDEADVKLMLYLLAESVCSRMRELVSRCTVVEIYVRDTELHSITRQRKLSAPSCSSQELADVGMELFRRHYHWERPIRSIGLRGAGLVEAQNCIQLSMYADDQKREKWERIDAAVDHLRQRYGYMSVRRALMDSDPLLGHINVRDGHTVHPVGYFGG